MLADSDNTTEMKKGKCHILRVVSVVLVHHIVNTKNGQLISWHLILVQVFEGLGDVTVSIINKKVLQPRSDVKFSKSIFVQIWRTYSKL
jgi:hypothetical protein